MRIEPINPIYKSTFNKKTNSNKNNQTKQKKKDKSDENSTFDLQLTESAKKKMEDDFER